jgi:hypothetical protein
MSDRFLEQRNVKLGKTASDICGLLAAETMKMSNVFEWYKRL